MEPPPIKWPQIIISPYLWIKILESWTAHLCLKKVLKVEGQEDFERKNKCRLWRDSNPGLPKPYSVFLRYMKNHLDCSQWDKVFTTFAYYFHLLIFPFFFTPSSLNVLATLSQKIRYPWIFSKWVDHLNQTKVSCDVSFVTSQLIPCEIFSTNFRPSPPHGLSSPCLFLTLPFCKEHPNLRTTFFIYTCHCAHEMTISGIASSISFQK